MLSVPGCFSDAPDLSAEESGGVEETVTLSGTVKSTALSDDMPLEGVKVSVVGRESVSAISDAAGNFVLENVPADRPTFLAAAPSNAFLGTVIGVDVRFADIEGIGLGQLSMLAIQTQLDALRQTDPSLELDETMGLIGALGNGVGAQVSLEPMPESAVVYGLDANGNASLGATDLAYWLFPIVVYFNVPTAPPGTHELSVEHATQSCTVDFAAPPTLARHITVVKVTCT